MIHHIVIWKLKDFAEGKSKLDNAKLMKEKLEALKLLIPNIIELRVGINITNEYSNGDIVLHSYFNNLADYINYQEHSEHKKVGLWISQIREERYCVDCEY
jgi:hypothetical protein